VRTLLLMLLFASAADAQTVSTFAGTGERGFSGDGGSAKEARLNNPYGVARGPDGCVYICDMDNHRIRKVAKDGVIATVAGNGRKGYAGDGGPAVKAALNQPYEMAWDASGNLFFVEVGNHVVRRINLKSGVISTIAGNGKPGFSGDGGPATEATLNQPHSLAFGSPVDLYVCDILNHRIRRIVVGAGVIETFAGDGRKKTSPDRSPIAGSSLHGPRAIAFAADGSMWCALREGNAVMKLDLREGKLQRMAGTGKSGFTGNGGPALKATLSGPKGISIAKNGNVYLADTESHSIRMIDSRKNTLELVVGDGKKGDGRESAPLQCRLARPHGVFVDVDGSVFIGDSENHRIRLLKP
jgi:sugar lactone lactonase YvrE